MAIGVAVEFWILHGADTPDRIVFHRSSLPRLHLRVYTAVNDAGFAGRGKIVLVR